MTLGFKENINGKPTYFVSKIWRSFLKGVQMNAGEFIETFKKLPKADTDMLNKVNPKIHTIREDKNNRWKAGTKIHFVVRNRTKNRFHFAPVVNCISVQQIKIKWFRSKSPIESYDGHVYNPKYNLFAQITISEKKLSHKSMNLLAINDGFESLEDFFNYFDQDFTGKIIHWTDLKY